MVRVKLKKEVVEDQITNDAKETIETGLPYMVSVTIQGVSDLLFHRWSCDEVEAKSALAKGSKGKKTDNIESFVYRNEEGYISLPGEYVRMSAIMAAKYRQDPRSPRKSAMDLYKAGIVCLTPLASLNTKEWDYEDRRRVVVQRSGISRIRPAMRTGWQAEFQFLINLPEYIQPTDLHDVLSAAGRLVGVGDFRPTYGRFQIVNFEIINDQK